MRCIPFDCPDKQRGWLICKAESGNIVALGTGAGIYLFRKDSDIALPPLDGRYSNDSPYTMPPGFNFLTKLGRSTVRSLAFVADGQTIVAGLYDDTQVWEKDSQTAFRLRTIISVDDSADD